MEKIEFHDSLPRVACLAALELENLAQDVEDSLEHVEKFVTMLNSNMNIDATHSYYAKNVDLSAIDPLTGYAVRQALRKSALAQQQIADIDSLINTIYQSITNPLQNILDSKDAPKSTKEDIYALSAICLSIAQIYSSFDRKHDKLENNPFR